MITAAASAALLAACGGNGTNAAESRTFTYGAAQAPTSNESNAAATAQTSLSDTATFSSSPDATRGIEIVGFASALASLAFGNNVVPSMPRGSDNKGALISDDFSTCATLTGNTVTFSGCSETSSGFTVTLNGSVTASAGSVSWNVTSTVSGTVSANGLNETVNVSVQEAGSFTVTATTVLGSATVSAGGNFSLNGQTYTFGLATAVDINVTYQTTPTSCVTGGTVEVKRVWTNRPAAFGDHALDDAGIKLTWTGCNQVQVAHSQ
jgi:hypothetical protein